MKKIFFLFIGFFILSACQTTSTPDSADPYSLNENEDEQSYADLVKGLNVKPNQEIKSPLTLKGEARGTWFFEASFPITLKDADGKILTESYAEAETEWMTENYVPFTAEINFEKPTTNTGELWIIKDNPSGLPENEDKWIIPVKFEN